MTVPRGPAGGVWNTPIRKVLRRAFGLGLHPNWRKVLREHAGLWTAAQREAGEGPQILIATSTGGYAAGTAVESMLAVALTLRGARPHVLLCDELLPACMRAEIRQFPRPAEFGAHGPARRLCRQCFAPAARMYRSLGIPVHRYGAFVTEEERRRAESLSSSLPVAEIPEYRLDGVAVGEHAVAGALRFFAQGHLDGTPFAEAVLRRYFHASLLTVSVMRRLLLTHRFACACFHHGIYVPQGIVGEVARELGVRVVTWNPAYRKKCFVFSHGDTYHHTLLDEPVSNWESLAWTEAAEAEILAYLKSRWQGTQDWIWFHENPREELAPIAAELGIDFSRPCVGMLTNVMWDAQLHYRANAFTDMLEWVTRTIAYFAGRPELQLIIRIHPAEVRGTIPSRQPLLAEVRSAFPRLPSNVFLIPPESDVSTYAVMLQCNAVIIYGTKTGVELSSLGVPVIVAGEAWIRGKGLTMDASSPEEYFLLLDRLPLAERLSADVITRARKYAYHFFFRRMIPLEFMRPQPGEWPPYRLELGRLEDLMPGRSKGLDVICDGVLKGTEFIFRAEDAPGSAGAGRPRGAAQPSGPVEAGSRTAPSSAKPPAGR